MATVPLTIDLKPTARKEIIFLKLDEYVANGAKLGFLIYPPGQRRASRWTSRKSGNNATYSFFR